MTRGGKVNLKGRRKQFTNPEQLEEERKKEERNKNWRKQDESSEEEDSDNEASGSGSSSSSESGDEKTKSKVTDDIENPNRIAPKTKKAAVTVEAEPKAAKNGEEKTQLSRREREEIEKQKARERYQKLHAEGKTDESRADMARLAIIRQQREDAAKKRDEEKKAKDAALAAKQAGTAKALGRKL